jgi:hypothetical protein
MIDYIDQNGDLRTAHNGEINREADVTFGIRDAGDPAYDGPTSHSTWGQVRDDPKIDTDPMDDPPIVNG